jgi:integrase
MARQANPWRRGGPKGPWYAWHRGKLVWLAPGSVSKADAWKRLAEVQSPHHGAANRLPDRSTVSALIRLYLADYAGRVERGERTHGTLVQYAHFLKSADRAFGGLAWEALSPRDVSAWLAGQRWASTTKADAVIVLRALANWARRLGHVATDPIQQVERPRSVAREHGLTPQQADAIRAAIAPDDPFADFFDFVRATGCRLSEAATLTADRIDMAGGVATVRCKRTRSSGTTRPVYLSHAAVAILTRLVVAYPDGPVFRNRCGRPWTPCYVAERFSSLARLTGIEHGCHCHSLRGLYCDEALIAGVSPAVVAALLGHSSPKVTLRHYSRVASRSAELLAAVRRETR